MKIEINKQNFIVHDEEFYRSIIKLAMFLSLYWVFCFTFFIVNIVQILNGNGLHGAINGSIQLCCLFLATMWIDEILNDH